MEFELKDTYFRRFLVPIIITFLILWGIVVIITNVPATEMNTGPMIGGAIKSAMKNFFRRPI